MLLFRKIVFENGSFFSRADHDDDNDSVLFMLTFFLERQDLKVFSG